MKERKKQKDMSVFSFWYATDSTSYDPPILHYCKNENILLQLLSATAVKQSFDAPFWFIYLRYLIDWWFSLNSFSFSCCIICMICMDTWGALPLGSKSWVLIELHWTSLTSLWFFHLFKMSKILSCQFRTFNTALMKRKCQDAKAMFL